jgi:hypothetical protein
MRAYVLVTTILNAIVALLLLLGLATSNEDRVTKAIQLAVALAYALWGAWVFRG